MPGPDLPGQFADRGGVNVGGNNAGTINAGVTINIERYYASGAEPIPDQSSQPDSHPATGLVRKAFELSGGEALDHLNRALGVIERDGNIENERLWSVATYNKATVLMGMGREGEAVADFQALYSQQLATADPYIRQLVAQGLTQWAAIVGRVGQHTNVLSLSDETLRLFWNDANPSLQLPIANALRNKALALGFLGQPGPSASAVDTLFQRFGYGGEPNLQEAVAAALLTKATSLWRLGMVPQVVQVYDAIIVNYQFSPDPRVQATVQQAQYWRQYASGAAPKGGFWKSVFGLK